MSPCNAWAVGTQGAGATSQTLAEHWNGASWTPAPSSNPGGSLHDSIFSGVAATSSSNAWAVGGYSTASDVGQTLIEKLSNGTWEQVSSPNPGGSTHLNSLNAVATTSAKNAWAVGEYVTGSGENTLIEHWNGTTWSVTQSPSQSHTDNLLVSVAATSVKNAWAVGYTFNSSGLEQTLIEHWDGIRWRVVPSPDPSGSANSNNLGAVAASSASNAWAVGAYFGKTGFAEPLIAHWNGKKWTRVFSPSLDRPSVRGGLQGLTVISATDAWAVGSYVDLGSRTLIAHWNGTTWSRVPSPNLAAINHLFGVAASSPGNIWAVGDYLTVDTDQTLAFHCC
jgi:hypothetical protein